MRVVQRARSGKVQYPFATVAFYGPDNQRASKLVAAVFTGPDEQGPLRRWMLETGDVRYDPALTAEVTAFLKEQNVVETVLSDRIIGCPHEEGIDYPEGGVCPQCPFWWGIDRWTHQPVGAAPAVPEKVGRNEPCPCGSGRKFKKCCGAPL